MDISSLLMSIVGANARTERTETKLPSLSPSSIASASGISSTLPDALEDEEKIDACDTSSMRTNTDQENPTETISPTIQDSSPAMGTIRLNSNIQETAIRDHNAADLETAPPRQRPVQSAQESAPERTPEQSPRVSGSSGRNVSYADDIRANNGSSGRNETRNAPRGMANTQRGELQALSQHGLTSNREVEVIALPISAGMSTKSLLKQLQNMTNRTNTQRTPSTPNASEDPRSTPGTTPGTTPGAVPSSLRTLRKIAPGTYAVPGHSAEELTRQAVSLYRESVLSFEEGVEGGTEEEEEPGAVAAGMDDARQPREQPRRENDNPERRRQVQHSGQATASEYDYSALRLNGDFHTSTVAPHPVPHSVPSTAPCVASVSNMRKYTSFDTPMVSQAFPIPLPLSRVVEMLTIDATCAPSCTAVRSPVHGGVTGGMGPGYGERMKPEFLPSATMSMASELNPYGSSGQNVQGAGSPSTEQARGTSGNSITTTTTHPRSELFDLIHSAYPEHHPSSTTLLSGTAYSNDGMGGGALLSPRRQVLGAPIAAVMGYVGRHSIDEDSELDREERIRICNASTASPGTTSTPLTPLSPESPESPGVPQLPESPQPVQLSLSGSQTAGSRDLLARASTQNTPATASASTNGEDGFFRERGRGDVLQQVRCTCPACFPCSACRYVPGAAGVAGRNECTDGNAGHRVRCIAEDTMEHARRPFPLSIDGIRYRGIVGSEMEIRRWDFAGITNISWEDEHGNVVQSRADRKFDRARLADLIRHNEEKKSWFSSKKKKASLPKMRFLYPFPMTFQDDHDPELDYLIGDQHDLHDMHEDGNLFDTFDLSTLTSSSQEIDEERLLEQLLELTRPAQPSSPRTQTRRDSLLSRSMKRMRGWWKRHRKTIAKVVVVVVIAGAIIGLSVISPLAGLFIAANAGFVAAAATTASVQNAEHSNELSTLRLSRLGVSQTNSEIDQNLVANLTGGYIFAE